MISYRVYGNSGSGGPVDYTAPLATVAGLTWSSPALAPGSDWTFAVRAFDPATGLEGSNTDARVRLILDGAGHDATARPDPPAGLSARATAGGGCLVEWAHVAPGPAAPPFGFRVWLQASGAIDFTLAPSLTVPYQRNVRHHAAALAGLAEGAAYAVGVRAYNAAGDDGNTTVALVTGSAAGPAPVVGLAGTTTYNG